jgi:Icc-related predicted phosphoesterase
MLSREDFSPTRADSLSQIIELFQHENERCDSVCCVCLFVGDNIYTVKILVTADTHLLKATERKTLELLRQWVVDQRPDCLVVAGDLSSAAHAEHTMEQFRTSFPSGPIVVCLGNHDFWLHDVVRSQFRSLEQVIEHFWIPAAKRYDVTLLDVQNWESNDLTIVGGYGHYDLGFAVPGLAYDGVQVTDQDYSAGYPRVGTALRWRDNQFMPALDIQALAAKQVNDLRQRLGAAKDSRVLAVLHTAPFEGLLGIVKLADLRPHDPPSEYAFFRAYLGNHAMGDLLLEFRQKLVGVVCGHTHRMAGPLDVGGVTGINIGSDYGDLKGAIFFSDTGRFERL